MNTELYQVSSGIESDYSLHEVAPSHAQTAIRTQDQSANSVYEEIKKQPPIDSDFNSLGRDLELETRTIKERFSRLEAETVKSVRESKVTVKKLGTFLLHIKAVKAVLTTTEKAHLLFTAEFLNKIESTCNNIEEVFRMLKGYYSWFNFCLLEDIINGFCGQDPYVHRNLFDYKNNLTVYCRNRVCHFLDPKRGLGEEINNALILKVDQEWETMRFSEIRTITTLVCDILKLTEVTLTLCSVSNGCVELKYSFPAHVIPAVFPLSDDQRMALQRTQILYCGEFKVYIL